MTLKDPQALASLCVQEPDIAGAGELALVFVPRQTLDIESGTLDHLYAAAGADIPDSDRAVSTARHESTVSRVEDGVVNPIGVTLEYL